nr:Hint domain-containing protein [uncultured Arsenicibacter sp.]
MKKLLYVSLALLINVAAWAQEEKRGITTAEFTAAKAATFKNLEKDSYFKSGGLVFDRNDEKPPYTFKFSDGLERKVYLYSLFGAEDMKSVGSLAVFTWSKSPKPLLVCIPNTLADKAIWGQYIDDLKDGAKQADGFAVCLAFALSREFSGGAKAEGAKAGEKDHNEFCFPADTYISLANGLEKRMDAIQSGDVIAGFGDQTVTAVTVHEGAFALTQVVVRPVESVLAAKNAGHTLMMLEATANHPILTAAGRKAMGSLTKGDYVFVANGSSYQLAEVVATHANARQTSRVYSINTQNGLSVINGVVTLDKQ